MVVLLVSDAAIDARKTPSGLRCASSPSPAERPPWPLFPREAIRRRATNGSAHPSPPRGRDLEGCSHKAPSDEPRELACRHYCMRVSAATMLLTCRHIMTMGLGCVSLADRATSALPPECESCSQEATS